MILSALSVRSLAAPAPYTPDAGTILLYHCDETTGSTVADAAGQFHGVYSTGTAIPATPKTISSSAGFPGFGGAFGNGVNDGVGVDVDGSGTWNFEEIEPADRFNMALLGNAFTLEAMVNLPTLSPGQSQHIWGGDGGNAGRTFQFRIDNGGLLRFDPNPGGSALTYDLTTLAGPHAFAANEWFHVAMTYTNGSVKFFWTRVDSGATAANLVYSNTLAFTTVPDAPLVFGNEGRSTGGLNEGLQGLMDEGRVSSVVRATNEFIFRSVTALEASSWQNVVGDVHPPQDSVDGDLNTRWSAQGDGEWITYDLGRMELVQSVEIAFYLGSTRTTTFDVLVAPDNSSWATATMVITNQVSSGTTLNLEAFDFTDVPGRYVRIIGHGNSSGNGWNSLTEVVVNSLAAADSDGDGLPDFWETFYFSSLSQTGTNDSDADLFNNLAEYNGNSNPTNALSTPLDTDADGLPDAWERTYFNSLAQGADDDYDLDTFSNLIEFNNGTNPADPLSNPGDTDGDGLPDAWELDHFGSLDQTADGDFDQDGYSNLAEYLAVTDPVSAASIPASPAYRYVPVDDGDPATSEFGYAGSSSINTVNFVHNALYTENGQQFLAYYYRHATSVSDPNNNHIVIARRNINSKLWELFFTPFTANSITDGHDVAAFGIDGNGFMHLSWGMHGDAFHYAKSTTSVFGTNAIGFGPDTTMTGNENTVTYPQWFRLPNGDLLYLFREGASGAGDTYLNHYSLSSQTWSNVHTSAGAQQPFLKGRGWSPDYNAYPNMPQLDDTGTFHLVWMWRDTPGYQSNHDFNYARSTNGGLTWQRFNGTSYTLPVSASGENGDPNTAAEIIWPIPQNNSLINQAGMCLDQDSNPVVATWWAPGTSTNNYRRQYMVLFRDGNSWAVRQISQRTNDPIGTIQQDAVVRDLGRPVVVCDPAGRVIVLYRDNFGSNGLTIAHTLPYAMDPHRTNWITFDLTTANLGFYEPVIDHARWALDQNLNIIYQPSQGLGYTPPANTAAQIGVVEWNAAKYFAHRPTLALTLQNNTNAMLMFNAQLGWGYRVQTSTNLVDWLTLTTIPGISGSMEYTHTNSAGSSQRYWRLQSQEGGFSP